MDIGTIKPIKNKIISLIHDNVYKLRRIKNPSWYYKNIKIFLHNIDIPKKKLETNNW